MQGTSGAPAPARREMPKELNHNLQPNSTIQSPSSPTLKCETPNEAALFSYKSQANCALQPAQETHQAPPNKRGLQCGPPSTHGLLTNTPIATQPRRSAAQKPIPPQHKSDPQCLRNMVQNRSHESILLSSSSSPRWSSTQLRLSTTAHTLMKATSTSNLVPPNQVHNQTSPPSSSFFLPLYYMRTLPPWVVVLLFSFTGSQARSLALCSVHSWPYTAPLRPPSHFFYLQMSAHPTKIRPTKGTDPILSLNLPPSLPAVLRSHRSGTFMLHTHPRRNSADKQIKHDEHYDNDDGDERTIHYQVVEVVEGGAMDVDRVPRGRYRYCTRSPAPAPALPLLQ